MKLDNQDKIKKRKTIEISVFIGIFLVLAMLTGFILGYVKKRSRDTIRLSDIQKLRYDLEWFYYKFNRFPPRILPNKAITDKTDCFLNLCLEYYPIDPSTGLFYDYTPCAGDINLNCNDNLEFASSYTLAFKLEAATGGIQAGSHIASPFNICADCGN